MTYRNIWRDPFVKPEGEDCAMTASGRYVRLFDPEPELVTETDIAHHLSQLNRYCGAARFPISVAQHTRLCSQAIGYTLGLYRETRDGARLRIVDYCLAALLHDAGEAYVGEMISPWKRRFGMSEYKAAEEAHRLAVFRRFNIDHSIADSQVIKLVDARMLATEWVQVMHGQPPNGLDPYRDCPVNYEPWDEARAAWEARFDELMQIRYHLEGPQWMELWDRRGGRRG